MRATSSSWMGDKSNEAKLMRSSSSGVSPRQSGYCAVPYGIPNCPHAPEFEQLMLI